MKLVKQKRIDARKMWPKEASDFTPWLSDNLEELAEKIGIELEFVDREVSVGPYSADILAKDAENGNFVVIENQLEKTNHDHLGKSITYASALNAKTIVWIATEFTEEHKKSLDWLNDNTNEDLSFWGIQLELWQISADEASLRFNIVSRPSSSVKEIKSKSANLTEASRIQLDFWTRFRDKLKATGKIKSLQTPAAQYWYDIALGKSGYHISNICNTQKNIIGVRLYIYGRLTEEVVPYLEKHKEEIEEQLGFQPEWFPNPKAKDKTVMITQKTDLANPEKVEESLKWLVDTTLIFRNVFGKLVKEFK